MAGFVSRYLKRDRWRQTLVHGGILATLLLTPVWFRLPEAPPLFPALYVSRFLILLPALWSIGCWLILGRPGWRDLLANRGPGAGARRLWALSLLTLALWAALSQTWAFQRVEHPEVGATAALQFGVMALFAVVVACSGLSPRAVIAALVLGTLWNSALVALQAAGQGALGLHGLGEFPFSIGMDGVSIIRAGDLTFVRPYGLMPHPNMLAGVLLVGVVAAGAWALSARPRTALVGAAITVLGVWALLLTFSRAAWVGLAAAGLVILLLALPLLRRRVHLRAALLTLAASAAAGVLFIALNTPFLAARVGEGQESVELRSVADRIVFTDFALRSIGERPLLGVGIGNFPWRASYYIAETFYDLRGDYVHHVLLAAWAELGTVGLALLLTAILSGALAAFRLIHAGGRDPDRIVLLAAFAALAVIGWFDHYPWTILHLQIAWWGSLAASLAPLSTAERNQALGRSYSSSSTPPVLLG